MKKNEKLDYQPQQFTDTYPDIGREDISDEEKQRYLQTNTALLFHGTRSVNVGGILSSGFRLPKELSGVVITGAMWGAGLYHANDYKKSVGYSSYDGSYWSNGSGKINNRRAFMFLNDIMLGNPVVPKNRISSIPKGYDSIWAKSNVSGVQNDEFIIFNKNQLKTRYLIEFWF